MTPQAQRIAIAEACPQIFDCIDGGVTWAMSQRDHDGEPVDPLNDLNAMHEAKAVLTPAQRREYIRQAGDFCKVPFDAYNFTADEEAEIFLRAIEKWEDDK